MTDFQFQPGDILFYKTEAISGKLIRFIQRALFGVDKWHTEFNHVSIIVSRPDLAKEAIIPKSLIRHANSVPKRELLAVVRPKYVNEDKETLDAWIEDQKKIVGQYYGIPQLVGLWWVAVCLLFKKRYDKNPIRAGRICTEDVYRAVKDLEDAFSISGIGNVNSDTLYLSTLYLLLQEVPEYYEIHTLVEPAVSCVRCQSQS